jgi:hypothetical protein
MSDSEKVKTYCKGCVFATMVNDTQTSCMLGKLEKFQEQGSLVELKDNYFTIDRVCNFLRSKKWGNKFVGKDLTKVVEEENKVKCSALVYVGKDHTIDDLKKTIDQLNIQVHPFEKVIFVFYHFKKHPFHIVYKIRQMMKSSDWEIEHILELIADKGRCVDIAVQKISHKKSAYYTFLEAGKEIPTQFVYQLNRMVTEEMFPVVLGLPNPSKPKIEHGYTALTYLHKLVGGNREKPFHKKIEENQNQFPPNSIMGISV